MTLHLDAERTGANYKAAGRRAASSLRISGSSASKVAHPAAGSPAGVRSANAPHHQLCGAVARTACVGAGPNGSGSGRSADALAASIHTGHVHSPPVVAGPSSPSSQAQRQAPASRADLAAAESTPPGCAGTSCRPVRVHRMPEPGKETLSKAAGASGQRVVLQLQQSQQPLPASSGERPPKCCSDVAANGLLTNRAGLGWNTSETCACRRSDCFPAICFCIIQSFLFRRRMADSRSAARMFPALLMRCGKLTVSLI